MNASWLQRLVTSTLRGYPNNAHLKELEKAPENLYLFKADEPDHDTLTAAVEGCEGIFHLATPAVPEDKIVDPERGSLTCQKLMDLAGNQGNGLGHSVERSEKGMASPGCGRASLPPSPSLPSICHVTI
eukprot:XP_020395973.1 uncharacterized protein LOC100275001 isoform X2 [Zea mays]